VFLNAPESPVQRQLRHVERLNGLDAQGHQRLSKAGVMASGIKLGQRMIGEFCTRELIFWRTMKNLLASFTQLK
jgi:hypothetical protein